MNLSRTALNLNQQRSATALVRDSLPFSHTQVLKLQLHRKTARRFANRGYMEYVIIYAWNVTTIGCQGIGRFYQKYFLSTRNNCSHKGKLPSIATNTSEGASLPPSGKTKNRKDDPSLLPKNILSKNMFLFSIWRKWNFEHESGWKKNRERIEFYNWVR